MGETGQAENTHAKRGAPAQIAVRMRLCLNLSGPARKPQQIGAIARAYALSSQGCITPACVHHCTRFTLSSFSSIACSRQIYYFPASCVFVKLIAFWANLLRFGQICCVSGRFIAPVRFVAFRADLLRPSNLLRFRQICCVSGRFVAPVRFLAFLRLRQNFLHYRVNTASVKF